MALAKLRTLNILRARRAANVRQLEVKICESGPPEKRPEPHNLSAGLLELIRAGTVGVFMPKGESKREDTKFYILRAADRAQVRERVAELLVDYRVFRTLTDKEGYCSQVLEGIVAASFRAAGRYGFRGRLPARTPLDGVYDLDGSLVGVEVKNVREWVYPMSEAVWVMIRKCLEIDAVPMLVCRKMAYVNRVMFGRLGIVGFEFYRQVFSERVAHLLPPIQHKDRLGYKDVIAAALEPHGPLVRFLQDTAVRQLPAYRER